MAKGTKSKSKSSKGGGSAAISGEFTGFAAFATHTSAAATAVQMSLAASTSSSSTPPLNSNNKTKPNQTKKHKRPSPQLAKASPIYTGSNSTLANLFKRIGQKRDAVTKCRALSELSSYAYPPMTSLDSNTTPAVAKNEQIAALSHFFFLFETKLVHDNHPTVRAESLNVLASAVKHVPKAFRTLLFNGNNHPATNGKGSVVVEDGYMSTPMPIQTVGTIMGWIYTSQCVSVAEVSKPAKILWKLILSLDLDQLEDASTATNAINTITDDENDGAHDDAKIIILKQQIIHHILSVLKCSSRPEALHSALFPLTADTNKKSTTSSKNNKNNNNKTNNDNNNNEISKDDRQNQYRQMEERFERVVLSALHGMSLLLRTHPEPSSNATTLNTNTPMYSFYFKEYNPSLLWKPMHSPNDSFRRAVYSLFGAICQYAPSLLFSQLHCETQTQSQLQLKGQRQQQGMSMSKMILTALSHGSDPSNYPMLLEMILIYISSFRRYFAIQSGGDGGNDVTVSLSVWMEENNNDPKTSSMVLDAGAIVKSVCKLLRKACYKCPSSEWAPTILPLLASLPRRMKVMGGEGDDTVDNVNGGIEGKMQLQILSSLWEGHTVATGVADVSAIVTAVTECASFLLLRKQPTQPQQQLQPDGSIGNDVDNRNNNDSSNGRMMDDAISQQYAHFFLRALSYYLEMPVTKTRSTPFSSATTEFVDTLARDLYKFDSVGTSERSDCIMYHLREWFWENLRTLMVNGSGGDGSEDQNGHINVVAITRLLKKLVIIGKDDGHRTMDGNLKLIMKELFHKLIHQLGAKELPGEEEDTFMLLIFEFCGMDVVFDTPGEMEKFCMDELIRWIIIATSSISGIIASDKVVELHFTLLLYCLRNVKAVSRRKTLWECVLSELIKTKCEVGKLGLGLSVLAPAASSDENNDANDSGVSQFDDLVRCETLENFAIQVGEAVATSFVSQGEHHQIDDYSDNEDGGDEHGADTFENEESSGISSFLYTCSGLTKKTRTMLVGPRVLQSWIHSVCDHNGVESLGFGASGSRNILLEVLLSIVLSGSSSIGTEDAIQLLLTSWRQGGQTWNSKGKRMLFGEDKSIYKQMRAAASSFLRKEVQVGWIENIDLECYMWSKRAWRLLQLCSVQGDHAIWPLSLIGLDDVETWKLAIQKTNNAQCDILYLCLTYFFENIISPAERRSALRVEGHLELLVSIFMSLVNWNPRQEQWSDNSIVRCAHLFTLLGGVDGVSSSLMESLCFKTIEMLSFSMKKLASGEKEIGTFSEVARGVTTLDWMLGKLRTKVVPVVTSHMPTEKSTDIIDPEKLKKGDILWYITNKNDQNAARSKVTLVKIHTEDYPNLYYTIKLEDDKVTGDGIRQTVASRLRTRQCPLLSNDAASPSESQPVHSDPFIQQIEEQVMNKLVKPYANGDLFSSQQLSREAAAECMNVVISRCGLRGNAGIGSLRYDVFQIVSSVEKRICAELTESTSNEMLLSSIKCLSTILGYGRLTSESKHNSTILRFSCGALMKNVLKFSEREDYRIRNQGNFANELRFVFLTLITICSNDFDREDTARIWALLKNITSKSWEGNGQNHSSFALKSLTAFDSICTATSPDDSDNNDDSGNENNYLSSQERTMSNLMNMYVYLEESNFEEIVTGEYFTNKASEINLKTTEPDWYLPFQSFLLRYILAEEDLFISSAMKHVEELYKSLRSPKKQWIVFQILSLLARKGKELYTEENVVLTKSTCERLDNWKAELDEEEAFELEEDVLVSARWLPQYLMSDIECWEEECATWNDEEIMKSKVLGWLICLDLLEGAAISDMRNRSHIVSYIDKTNVVKEVFGTLLSQTNLENHNQDDWISSTSINDQNEFSLSQISMLGIFRMVESMPTLCKMWWTDFCPRSMQSIVSQFVQSKVAPETLRRELARIDKATNLGDLSVNGSCVSREVTATYIQDECQLSVLIRIPQSFPLRNAEVDCKKTLGISEKRWRHWSLQIMRMLNSQDGSVLDALMLWKQNVDKEFDGVEPCPVCYSVLCVKTHAMPNLECKTCQNRFHSSCLYKWFQSSGKNQCVLCQQPWSGTKVS